MSKQFKKYGLKNANELLRKIRKKYYHNKTEENETNKTFNEDDAFEISPKKIKAFEHDLNSSENVINQVSQIQERSALQQNKTQLENQDKEVSFCDRLIIKSMEQTLKRYESDYEVLNDNRKNLEQAIQLIAEKVRKIKQIVEHNLIIKSQNFKNKTFYLELIKEYFQSSNIIYKHKLQQQQKINKKRRLFRKVLEITDKDQLYTSFTLTYNQYQFKIQSAILQIQNEEQKKHLLETKIVEKPKFQKIISFNNKQEVKKKEDQNNQYEEKPKKKLSQNEKASIVGDLKNFAKNFRIPS